MPIDSTTRRIEHGSCLWCGHKPHDERCTARIRTSKVDKDPETPCPCTRHEWVKSRSPEAPPADGTDSSGGR